MSMCRSVGIAALAFGCLTACELFEPTSEAALPLPDAGLGLDGGLGDTGTGPGPGVILGPNGLPISGRRLGDACSTTSPCREGLACDAASSTCAPSGAGGVDTPCTIAGECGEGLTCSIAPACLAAGNCFPSALVCVPVRPPSVDANTDGSAGSPCFQPLDCQNGFRCNLVGLGGICETEGSGDIGAGCTGDSDCSSPLACAADGFCKVPIPQLGGVRTIPDTACDPVDSGATFRAYFEVPRAGQPSKDFFRLPFPNDIRRTAKGVDLTGFPNPGTTVLAGDVIDAVVKSAGEQIDGFSSVPTVYFRFSRAFGHGTVRGERDQEGNPQTLFFHNIDQDSQSYGFPLSMAWFMTTGRGKFICDNYLAVQGSWRDPLEHDTTYAVWLTDGVRDPDGNLPVRDPDLSAMLGATAPSNADLAAAWEKYAPLRAYFADKGIATDNIISAAVFTTGDPDRHVGALRAATRAEANPALDDLTVCKAGATSPCADGESRACITADGDFVQIHATYQAPVWQRGTRPYLRYGDGGEIVWDSQGRPVRQGEETMCLSMTIPTGAMPEGGWPVVMFAHGTGGDFLSHIRSGVARNLASIDLGEGEPVRVASVSIDGVLHANRRGDSNVSPDTLVYNFANPPAARDNIFQGAADYFFLTHLLENVDIGDGELEEGLEVRFDPERMYFFGHSQGATVGAPFVAWESNVKAGIFSGGGGGLTLSLLNKTQPFNVAAAVGFVLGEGTGRASSYHPVLSLIQHYFNPVDSMNYGRLLFRSPPEGVPSKHILMSYGKDDSYTPEATMQVFGAASQLPQVRPAPFDVSGFPGAERPVTGNRAGTPDPVTGAMVAYTPSGYDGHFVLLRDPQGVRDYTTFIGTAVRSGTPTIPVAE